jgi:hypothetical protein
MRRRGVLFVVVVLPDGGRSLIPAEWTDWSTEQAGRTPADDLGEGGHALGRLDDLIRLRNVIDALCGRRVESARRKESSHAIESGVSRPARSSTRPLAGGSIGERMETSSTKPRASRRSRSSHVSSPACCRPGRRRRKAMNERAKITASHLSRHAIVYLRQSSAAQVENNRESTERQYALVGKAP